MHSEDSSGNAMKHTCLSLLMPVIAFIASTASAQPAPDAGPWGEAADALQLNLSVGPNTGAVLESRAMLFVSLAFRNVSDKPVDVPMASYDFVYDYEYEFDGTWYAAPGRRCARVSWIWTAVESSNPLRQAPSGSHSC